MITYGTEDTLTILHRADVIGNLTGLLPRVFVVALASELVDALNPWLVLKCIGILLHLGC